MSDLDGLVLQHRDFGYCKITAQTDSTVRVKFIGTNRDSWYRVELVAAQKEFKWRPMPIGLKCRVADRGTCTIVEGAFGPSEKSGVHEYLVVFDDQGGLSANLSERELWPIPDSLVETAITKITGLQADSINHFRTREGFLNSLKLLNKESDGITALVGSRIELLPHQAYVVRTVLNDPLCRYILADEVGLGKTIEAGVVAHQTLADKPDAKILILTPGPLSRQWLCEMRMSFGGRDFRLLDLHPPQQVTIDKWPLVISSMKIALRSFEKQITQAKWDLLIVDEAHQLLWNQSHYEFVEKLALRVPKLLLLSAVPARERSTELMRLLKLIEPNRYADGSVVASKFEELYAIQSSIGKRWKIVDRGISKGDQADIDQLHLDVQRLLSTQVLNTDSDLQALGKQAELSSDKAEILKLYQHLADEVVSKYRLSRRILKNRRTQLSELEMFPSVARDVEFITYQSSDLELEIEQVGLELLSSAFEKNSSQEAIRALARKMLQGMCDPVALYEIAGALSLGDRENDLSDIEFDSEFAYDYDEHDDLISNLGDYFCARVDQDVVSRWLSLLRAAIDTDSQSRVRALDSSLSSLISDGLTKILLFAGTPGTAEFLTDYLRNKLGKESVASFRNDLSDDDKETQVTRFKHEPRCLILVSDESGGEGRNFQFADCLIHFDLPWSVAAIEQRIGRLDRVGRTCTVKSIVVHPKDGLEKQWVACLHKGFGVFTRSISGLEYMLRVKENMVLNAVSMTSTPDLELLVDQIRDASEVERASDDAEAITDAASFRSRGNILEKFSSGVDQLLERSMTSYMRMIARPESARKVTDSKDLNLKTWRLRPDDVSEFQLPGMDRDGDNPLRERFGTFDRDVARDRLDLEFFSIGHPLVDALTSATQDLVRGRTFFVKTSFPALPHGIYVFSIWRVELDNEHLLPERVRRLLGVRSISVGIDYSNGDSLLDDTTRLLFNHLKKEESKLADVSIDSAIELLQPEQGGWSKLVEQFIRNSEESSKEAYKIRYGASDDSICKAWQSNLEYVQKNRPEETEDYQHNQRLAIKAVSEARLKLDVLGLIHVN